METTTLDTRALQLVAPPRHAPFRRAAVLGAGTMGAQIAAHLANAGLGVDLLDIAAEKGNSRSVVESGFKRARKMRPDPLFSADAAERIELGTFDEDLEVLGRADWVVEAVVERLDVKRELMEKVESLAREDAIISTNTSGIPIHEIHRGRSASFKSRFLGTHFFNPPRYLKLLELVPTADTSREVIERIAQFGRLHLGKGIVLANDVPYFIGNRVGVYSQLQAIRYFTEGDFTIEEIDLLTGPLVGRPRSATFRTADIVGLDVLQDVANNLYEKLPHDERRDAFQVPRLITRLMENGARGAKTGAGFYKKEGGVIKSVNPETLEYEEPSDSSLEVEHIRKAGELPDRLRALFDDDGRAGTFFRETMLDLMSYSARRVGEITDIPAEIDRAIKWGFGWEIGPFETWDTLGYQRVVEEMQARQGEVPEWATSLPEGFYMSATDGRPETSSTAPYVFLPVEKDYVRDSAPVDEVDLAVIRDDEARVLWQNDEAALLDLGEGVTLYEFRSKANTLGRSVMQGLHEAIGRVERDRDLRGMVIGNDGKNFAVGANLAEIARALQEQKFDQLERYLKVFQDAVQRIRYAGKPVVVATHQRVLGGGCEMAMACPHPVAAAETYIGLVELGVGVIPAGTGTMRLAAQASANSPTTFPSHIQPFLQERFESVAKAAVAESAEQGIELGYLPEQTRVVMHEDRRLHVAKRLVYQLSEEGYRPPPVQTKIHVLGEPTRAAFDVALQQYRDGEFISEYDQHLGRRLAYVITGGDLTAPQAVHEDYLIELEREVFLDLLGEKKTQDRIRHMLEKGKPLRN